MADMKLIGIAVLFVLLAGAALFVLPGLMKPATPAATATPAALATLTPEASPTPAPASLEAEYDVDPASVDSNTRLYLALVDSGLEEPFVDVTEERVLIRYELPANYSSQVTAYHVFGLAAGLEPNATSVLLQGMVGDRAVEEWEAATVDIRAYADGALPPEQFEARVRHTTL